MIKSLKILSSPKCPQCPPPIGVMYFTFWIMCLMFNDDVFAVIPMRFGKLEALEDFIPDVTMVSGGWLLTASLGQGVI